MLVMSITIKITIKIKIGQGWPVYSTSAALPSRAMFPCCVNRIPAETVREGD